MNEIEDAIRSLHKQGKTPRAISTELYIRGLKNSQGKFLTADVVEGFLRHGRTEPVKPPAVLPAGGDLRNEAVSAVPVRRAPGFRGEWPPCVNYGGDPKLGLNDNTYPDAPPYNYTHQGQYVTSLCGGISSAAIAVMGGA